MGLYAAGQEIVSSTSGAVASTPAAVPRLVQFSGFANDTRSQPLTRTIGITFLLYRDEQVGYPLWMEVQNVKTKATRHYSVQLGATRQDGVVIEDFSSGEARWLGVQITGKVEQPRAQSP